jgi:hypothetical protein
MFGEVGRVLFGVLGPDNYNGNFPVDKLINVLAQLCQMRAAEWSDKAPIEDQKHILFALKMGQANHISLVIL